MGNGIAETTNYILFTNPISQGFLAGLSGAARGLGITQKSSTNNTTLAPIKIAKLPLYELAGSSLLYTRIAGISGASAIAISAYYTHYHKSNRCDPELIQIFEKTNKFHFMHSLLLVGVPLVRHPWLTGMLMTQAMVIFCGSGYYHAFTGDSRYRFLATIGNCLIFFSWMSMLL